MHSRVPTLHSVIVATSLVMVAGACSRGADDTITFGAAGPFSQAYGLANKEGIELATDENNASPTWSGARHLNIAFANDSGTGLGASMVAQAFVDSTQVIAVVGYVNSGAMVAAAHVYDTKLDAIATTASESADQNFEAFVSWYKREHPDVVEAGQ